MIRSRAASGLIVDTESIQSSFSSTRTDVARSEITANGEALAAGDALRLIDATTLRLSDGTNAEVLSFDLREKRQ